MSLFAVQDAVREGGLTSLDQIVIGIYLAAMLGMGFWIARKQRSTDDFFVGGRNLPAWAVGISIFASLLSTLTYLGMPGEMFRTGVAFLTRQLPIPLVLIVVCFLWIPFSTHLVVASSWLVTIVACHVFCLLMQTEATDEQKRLMWLPVTSPNRQRG